MNSLGNDYKNKIEGANIKLTVIKNPFINGSIQPLVNYRCPAIRTSKGIQELLINRYIDKQLGYVSKPYELGLFGYHYRVDAGNGN